MNSIVEEFKYAFKRPDNGLIQLLVINLAVFVILLVLEVLLTISGNKAVYDAMVLQLMMPSDIDAFFRRPWTLITYFFTHTGFFHILFNMLFLYWFGRLIAEFMGNRKVVSLYILGGIAGGFFFMLIYNMLPFFADRVAGSAMLGASAGVFAVTVGAATLMPNYTFVLFLIGPVKIKYIAIFYVFVSFVQSTGANAGGELAHLGGALIGYLYVKQIQNGTDWGRPVWAVLDFFGGLFKRKSKIRVTHSNRTSTTQSRQTTSRSGHVRSRADQDEIDAILDKISASGYESLTKEEKQKLFNASKK